MIATTWATLTLATCAALLALFAAAVIAEVVKTMRDRRR